MLTDEELEAQTPTALAPGVRDAISDLFTKALSRFTPAASATTTSAAAPAPPSSPPPPHVVYVGGGDDGGWNSNRARGSAACCRGFCKCSPCSWLILLVSGLALIVGATLFGISVSGAWRAAQTAGDGLAAVVTRLAALQTHHNVLLLTDVYGDAVGAEAAATEFPPRELGAVAGSVDVHARRIDWALTVHDPNARLTTIPLVALWVQRYNVTSHHLTHTARSPLVLCRGEAMRASVLGCSGTEQRLEHIPDGLDGGSDSVQLSVVVFASEAGFSVHPSEPDWFIPL